MISSLDPKTPLNICVYLVVVLIKHLTYVGAFDVIGDTVNDNRRGLDISVYEKNALVVVVRDYSRCRNTYCPTGDHKYAGPGNTCVLGNVVTTQSWISDILCPDSGANSNSLDLQRRIF